MSVDELLKRIEAEQKTLRRQIYDGEGLGRLQSVMKYYDGEYRLVWSDEIKVREESVAHLLGMASLDEALGGLRPRQLISIGADSGHGKTTMGLFLVEKLAALNPLCIHLEQSSEELIDQRRGNGYSVPRFLLPLSIATRVTTDWIEERVVEGIAKHNTKLVLIDHLGYINDQGKDGQYQRENLAYRIGQIMKGLKNIAKKWEVIIILLVHISQHDEGKPPARDDIKNSSDIVQESDVVILMWRKNTLKNKVRVYENKTMLSIQKNRRTGKNPTIGLAFDTATGNFIEDGRWVDSLMKKAEASVEAENLFHDF